jgi:hypothetical protein
MQNILRQGYPAIAAYMKIFSPTNAQNIHSSTSMEGWTIASMALKRGLFSNAYEEAKLVSWAGTCHVMMSGQLLKHQVTALDLDSLLQYFGPVSGAKTSFGMCFSHFWFLQGINFFMNTMHIIEGQDRELEVIPFARFELFGLWSTLGLSFKDTDPDRMVCFQHLLSSSNCWCV